MSWKLAAAAVTLRDQVNKRYRKRDKASDGTKGDDRHARRISDHNPDKSGYVMALDIDEDFGAPGTSRTFADQLVDYCRTSEDKRIKNIVYEGKVASGTYADHFWTWRKQPSLGHEHHIHISFAEAAKHDGRPFPLAVLELPRTGLQPTSENNKPTSSSAVHATVTPAKKAAKKAPAKKATAKP